MFKIGLSAFIAMSLFAGTDIVPEKVELPEKVAMNVQFYAQAPRGDWSEAYKEACEEASLVLAINHLKGEQADLDTFDKQILDMEAFEKGFFGYHEDMTIPQLAQVVEEYVRGIKYEVIEKPSVDDLKEELFLGNLIVAPFAGQMLENPFFKNPGPRYHMLVIVGYDKNGFITNDVGTKRGKDFKYSYENMMNALYDYHPDDMTLGGKRVLVLKKT